MTAIAGIVDPNGVDRDAVLRACAAAPWRGTPHGWFGETAALVAFDRGGGTGEVFASGNRVTVADGRFDEALGDSARRAVNGRRGIAAKLDAVVNSAGWQALDDIAAEFACASWDGDTAKLVLARDVFGCRPLLWARRGGRFAFATDPEVLLAIGVADRALERDVVAAHLACRETGDDRTPFAGIRRVIGGTALVLRDSELMAHRWFRPEAITKRDWTVDSAAEELRPILIDAVRARAAGKFTTIQLSGGRDSAAVTMAAALANLDPAPVCITYRFDGSPACSEDDLAAEVAAAAGFKLVVAELPSDPTEEMLRTSVARSVSPLGPTLYPTALATTAALREIGTEVVMSGDGGEPLFLAGPVAVLDLLRQRNIRLAVATSRSYVSWKFRWSQVIKTVLREAAPSWLSSWREQTRPAPPWVRGALPPVRAAQNRSASDELRNALYWHGSSSTGELVDGGGRRDAIVHTAPLLDRRVVNLTLSLPSELRTPLPEPKSVLVRAVLGDLATSRRKTNFAPYYRRLEYLARDQFGHQLGSASLLAQDGYIDADRVDWSRVDRWPTAFLRCLVVEAWLQRHRSATGAQDDRTLP